LLICISSAVVLAQSLARLSRDKQVFVQHEQLRQVMIILLPSTAYVLGIQFIGIYVSSAVFICLFMRIIGRYTWLRSAAVGVAVSAVLSRYSRSGSRSRCPRGRSKPCWDTDRQRKEERKKGAQWKKSAHCFTALRSY
jgi:hypothetical protein